MGVTVQPLSTLRTQSCEEHERAYGEQRLPCGPDHHAYRGDAMGDPDDIDDVPRIYVACLACHSAGRLHGRWFEVGTDPDELHHEVLGHFATGCETCTSYESECPECRARHPADAGVRQYISAECPVRECGAARRRHGSRGLS